MIRRGVIIRYNGSLYKIINTDDFGYKVRCIDEKQLEDDLKTHISKNANIEIVEIPESEWEYRHEYFSSPLLISKINDENISKLTIWLNMWAEDGWELVSSQFTKDNQFVNIILKRPRNGR